MSTSKIRLELDEFETISRSINETVATFFGNCVGIRLTKRGLDDDHICFEVLCEDDLNWFPSRNGFSTHWLSEFLEVSKAAHDWLRENADRDGNHGWKVRSK